MSVTGTGTKEVEAEGDSEMVGVIDGVFEGLEVMEGVRERVGVKEGVADLVGVTEVVVVGVTVIEGVMDEDEVTDVVVEGVAVTEGLSEGVTDTLGVGARSALKASTITKAWPSGSLFVPSVDTVTATVPASSIFSIKPDPLESVSSFQSFVESSWLIVVLNEGPPSAAAASMVTGTCTARLGCP